MIYVYNDMRIFIYTGCTSNTCGDAAISPIILVTPGLVCAGQHQARWQQGAATEPHGASHGSHGAGHTPCHLCSSMGGGRWEAQIKHQNLSIRSRVRRVLKSCCNQPKAKTLAEENSTPDAPWFQAQSLVLDGSRLCVCWKDHPSEFRPTQDATYPLTWRKPPVMWRAEEWEFVGAFSHIQPKKLPLGC